MSTMERNMSLLRFTTAGSVDDGKSTLIGRLLYDSKSIFEDQLESVAQASESKGLAHVDLSLLTDGLRAEREQGITIDVAYRYFSTPKRKFIIADTPGHIQYTRNMVTGASTASVMGIIGKIQGVKLVKTPAKNTNKKVQNKPFLLPQNQFRQRQFRIAPYSRHKKQHIKPAMI